MVDFKHLSVCTLALLAFTSAQAYEPYADFRVQAGVHHGTASPDNLQMSAIGGTDTGSAVPASLAYDASRQKKSPPPPRKRTRNQPKGIGDVNLLVDLSQQKMKVYLDGQHAHTWPISSGKRRYETPTGRYKPQVMKKHHRSSKYNNAPMPYSIFFRGGYAIHAGKGMGRPRSHGCIRIAHSNAQKLYQWVSQAGRHNTDITIKR